MAQRTVFHGNGRIVRLVARACDLPNHRFGKRLAQRRRRLAADADDGRTVGAVGRELDVEHHAVHADRLCNGLAKRMLFLQDQDTVHLAAGVIGFVSPSSLPEHSMPKLSTPAHARRLHDLVAKLCPNDRNRYERAGRDVLRTGDNL